jgi:hypothetical protein
MSGLKLANAVNILERSYEMCKIFATVKKLTLTSDATRTPFDVLETSVVGAFKIYAGYTMLERPLDTDLLRA